MSNFTQKTKHPVTGKIEEADWLDDYFGRHQYGVRFPSDGKVYEDKDLEVIKITKYDGRCICDLCNGKYVQIDPVGCSCTECIIGEYRPAINEKDYEKHHINLTNYP